MCFERLARIYYWRLVNGDLLFELVRVSGAPGRFILIMGVQVWDGKAVDIG
jgi:hypothetical protein